MLGFGFQLCGPICWNHFLTDDATIHTYSTSFFFQGRLLYFYLHFSIHAMAKILIHIFLMWPNWSGIYTAAASAASVVVAVHIRFHLPHFQVDTLVIGLPACLPLARPLMCMLYTVHTIQFIANFAKWKLIEKVLANAGAFLYPFRDPINGDFAMKFETIFLPILSFAFLTQGLLWSSIQLDNSNETKNCWMNWTKSRVANI